MSETSTQNKKRKKLNSKLAQILNEIGGENCVKIGEELYNIKTPEITDDELAEICNIKLNIVRKILYILYENKLSVFRKVRDKKSGWFIYYWHQNFDNVKELIKLKHQQVLEKLQFRLEYEDGNVFYKCDNPETPEEDSELAREMQTKLKEREKKIQELTRSGADPSTFPPEPTKPDCLYMTTFNNAMDNDFKCPRCGGLLNFYENAPVKDFLREKIAILRQNIKNFG